MGDVDRRRVLELLQRPIRPGPAARRAGYGPQLRHIVRVPAGPEGRPGMRLLAPSRSLHLPWAPSPVDRSRTDFRVVVTRGGSTLAAICLGPVAERGTPHVVAARDRVPGSGAVAPPSERLLGVDAPRRDTTFPHSVVHDFYVERDGWLFVVGVHRPRVDPEEAALERMRAALATWRWIDADAAARGWPARLADAAEAVPSWPEGRPARPRALEIDVDVAPVVGAASGYRLRAPGPSVCRPFRGADGMRTDLHLRLPDGGRLSLGVLGRTGAYGTAQAVLERQAAANEQRGVLRGSPVTRTEVAGELAAHLRLVGGGQAGHHWLLAHRGWLHAVDVLCDAAAEPRTLATTRAILDTWSWRDPAWAEPRFTEPAWRPHGRRSPARGRGFVGSSGTGT